MHIVGDLVLALEEEVEGDRPRILDDDAHLFLVYRLYPLRELPDVRYRR